MSGRGFQPVCVLYQGNNSPFDGTCQLVCRHQIQQEEFSQGNIVQVHNIPSGTPATGGGGGSDKKQAIVMGDEMVSTLIGTLFNTQLPQTSTARKRHKGDDDAECNAEMKQDTGLLQEILSVVKEIKTDTIKLAMELSSVKRRQAQLEMKIGLVHEAFLAQNYDHVDRQGFRGDISAATSVAMCKGREEAVQSTDVSADSGGHTNIARMHDIVTVKEEPSSVSCSTSVLHDVAEVYEDEMNDDDGHDGTDSYSHDTSRDTSHDWNPFKGQMPEGLPLENNESYLCNLMDSSGSNGVIRIGDPSGFNILMPLSEMEDILYKTNNATSFAYRLAGRCFSEEEMITGNTRGGGTRTNGESFKQLNPDILSIIAKEVMKRFPHSATDKALMRCVKNAVNERCRNARKKMTRLMGQMNQK